MGKEVITTPDDKLQPLLWDWDGLVELKDNALFHCIRQHKRENYSVAENRQKKSKSLIPHPQLLSIKQKDNTRVCSIFQIQLS